MVNCGIAIRLPSYKNCCECFWNEPFCTQGALAYTYLMKQFDDGSIGSIRSKGFIYVCSFSRFKS